jgi:hypothetical protein
LRNHSLALLQPQNVTLLQVRRASIIVQQPLPVDVSSGNKCEAISDATYSPPAATMAAQAPSQHPPPQAISDLPPHTFHLIPSTSYLPPHTYHLIPPTSYLPPHTSHLIPPTSYLPPPTSHLIPPTYPLTSHLIPPTFHLIPPTSHLPLYSRTRIRRLVTLFYQALNESKVASSGESLPIRSPILFDAVALNVAKQSLGKTKSVSFAPLPSPWRPGARAITCCPMFCD